MGERIPCITEGCKATILQITADRTGGYCMPCYQRMKRKEREEFIKKNRKDVNLYANISDPVEILKIMHKPKKCNPLDNYVKYEKVLKKYILLFVKRISYLDTRCRIPKVSKMFKAYEVYSTN